jgi:hypothetical protein
LAKLEALPKVMLAVLGVFCPKRRVAFPENRKAMAASSLMFYQTDTGKNETEWLACVIEAGK